MRRPLTHGMEVFLRRFRKTRFIVENSIGIIKNIFPVLKYGFRIRQHQKAAAITLACVALHNIQNEHVNGRYDEAFLDNVQQGSFRKKANVSQVKNIIFISNHRD